MAAYSNGTENKLKICRLNCLGVQIASPLPGDSDLSHFGNDRINVSRKVWVESPKRNKQYADELTQMRMKEVKETVAQFVKYERNQIK